MDIQAAITDTRTQIDALNQQLSDPEVFKSGRAASLSAQLSDLQPKLELFESYQTTQQQLAEAKQLLDDTEMRELAQAEIPELEAKLAGYEEAIRRALVPTDPNDVKAAIVEIRAGAGGDESSIFAGDLLRMYIRYCERMGLTATMLSESANSEGGYKEVIFEVSGERAYGTLKYESGVHRVQRVPVTESSGRIHTSTATVAVLPEAEESEVEISPNELRIDVYRSSGHGGQSVNTTDSAVRITHLPTGIVVTCQDEKSQLKNKAKAMSVLRSRLLDLKAQEEAQQLGDARRSQIGTGDRSEKIRTYNYPQDRVTDHRIGYTTHNLPKIMDGDIGELVERLHEAAIQKALESQI
jgi:peptide chain release factor 1